MDWDYSLVVACLLCMRTWVPFIPEVLMHTHTQTKMNKTHLAIKTFSSRACTLPQKPLKTVLKGGGADELGLAYRLKWISHPCFRKNSDIM